MSRSRHAILYVTPFDPDTAAVNRLTGSYGYGHVALWGGDMDGDMPIVLDSSIGNGVGFRRLDVMTRGVPYVSQFLDDRLGARVFAKAMACIGARYHYWGLVSGRVSPDAFTCSGLVCCALPLHLEKMCRPSRGPVSPNDIARSLGVPKWSPP